jgi:hypothetical protein
MLSGLESGGAEFEPAPFDRLVAESEPPQPKVNAIVAKTSVGKNSLFLFFIKSPFCGIN